MKPKQPAAVKLSLAGYNSNDFIEIIGDILFRYNLKLCDTQTTKVLLPATSLSRRLVVCRWSEIRI